jgi:hypothetical protein
LLTVSQALEALPRPMMEDTPPSDAGEHHKKVIVLISLVAGTSQMINARSTVEALYAVFSIVAICTLEYLQRAKESYAIKKFES